MKLTALGLVSPPSMGGKGESVMNKIPRQPKTLQSVTTVFTPVTVLIVGNKNQIQFKLVQQTKQDTGKFLEDTQHRNFPGD
jgi:hypothetical protein